MSEKKIDTRARNWATVVYPESAPDNWMDVIRESKIPCLISPLHDKDVNPDGTPKKPHRHVLACLEGKKSKDQMTEFFKSFGGVGCERVESLRGYGRYLCHLDNPEKAQYKVEDVQCCGGISYQHITSLASDKYKAIREMKDFCRATNCYVYSDLVDYACEFRYDWYTLLCDSCSYLMIEYVKSLKFKADNNIQWEPPKAVDEDGVIIE